MEVGIFIVKYIFELNLKIVHDYLDCKGGISYLSKKYSVKNPSQDERWINAYREIDEEGLVRKWQNQKHSVQFKLDASFPLFVIKKFRQIQLNLNILR